MPQHRPLNPVGTRGGGGGGGGGWVWKSAKENRKEGEKGNIELSERGKEGERERPDSQWHPLII